MAKPMILVRENPRERVMKKIGGKCSLQDLTGEGRDLLRVPSVPSQLFVPYRGYKQWRVTGSGA